MYLLTQPSKRLVVCPNFIAVLGTHRILHYMPLNMCWKGITHEKIDNTTLYQYMVYQNNLPRH